MSQLEGPLTEEELKRMREDPEVLAIIRQSLQARREGRMIPWNQVKRELELENEPA